MAQKGKFCLNDFYCLALANALFLPACSTTSDFVGEMAVVPAYVAVAIPAVVTYPLWSSTMKALEARELPKNTQYIIQHYGVPASKYDCGGIQVWEYESTRGGAERRFILLLDPEATIDPSKTSLPSACSLHADPPTPETRGFYLAEVVPCGGLYGKQVHDMDVFFVDMSTTEGTVYLETKDQDNSSYNASFAVMYEGVLVHKHRRWGSPKISGFRIEKLKFGPGTSTFLEVRIFDKPLLWPIFHYYLSISCPE